MHAYTFTYIYIYTYVYVHAYACARACAYARACAWACIGRELPNGLVVPTSTSASDPPSISYYLLLASLLLPSYGMGVH